MHHGELLIDGYWMGGPCDSSMPKDVVRSPWDDHLVGYVAEGSWATLDYALDAAAVAIRESRLGTPIDRRELLERVACLIRESRTYLAELLTEEIGKPISLAFGEIDRAEITFRIAAGHVPDDEWETVDLAPDARSNAYRGWMKSIPLGTILGFVPYNWPINLAAHKLAPAIAAGCPIIIKLSPKAPLSTLALIRLIHSAGAPPGVVQAWHGADEDAQRAVSDDRVAVFSFTGSVKVGWSLRAKAKRTAILELGGMAPVVLFPGANQANAIPDIAASAFSYAGQICISTQQVWVHDSMADDVIERLRVAAQVCPTGDPSDPVTVCGPLIDRAAADRIEGLIAETGTPVNRNGNLVHPTVIEVPSSGDPTWRVLQEEAFGPLVTVHRWQDRTEVSTNLTKSPFRIHAAVYSSNEEDWAWAEQSIAYPGLTINCPPSVRFDALPYGGDGQSGLGREGIPVAIAALRTYRSKTIRT